MSEHEMTFQVPLGGGHLEMEPRDALELRSFARQPGYKRFRLVMEAINEASKRELQLPSNDLDTLRVHQGRIQAVAEIACIIERDLEQWYEEGKSSERDEETA